MNYYNEQLQMLGQQVARKNHLVSMLDDLHIQKEELETKVNELKAIMEKEQADVDKFEGGSFASFFYGVVGKKDEKLDKERQEAYTAAVKYDVAAAELETVKKEIMTYRNELSELANCEEYYAKIMKEKAEAIKASGSTTASKILQLEEEISHTGNQKKEIKEAISAGNKTLTIIDSLLSDLSDAKGWGTWDMLGGGFIADFAKHSSLDEAQKKVTSLQKQLRCFKTELSDVQIYSGFHVNVQGFTRFADYFFDGLFVDWMVMDKISQSQSQVEETNSQVKEVVNRLTSMLTTAERKQQLLKEELDKLIVEE